MNEALVKESVNTSSEWPRSPISEICDVIRGVTYKKAQSSDKPAKNRLPVLRATNIQEAHLVLEQDLVYVPSELVSEKQRLIPGDIVIATSSGSKHLVGKTAQVRGPWEGSFGAFCAAIRPKVDINPRYLGYFFESPEYKKFIAARAMGININNLRRADLEEISVPIAPRNQQDCIVAEIEKQFSRLDEAVASLKRVKANLKRYKTAVLKAAVEGKLTEEWRKQNPDVEPASKLIERILDERREKWEEAELTKMKAKGKVPKDDKWKENYADFDLSDIHMPNDLPESWGKFAIGQIFDVVVGATPSRREPVYWGGGIPWVSSGEVDFCKITETRETISSEGLANSSTKINPVGTVLLGMIGEGKTRGQAAILEIEACNNQNSAAIRVSETEILPNYIYYFLVSQYEETRRRGSGGNQPALNKNRVQRISCPLPPVAEQIEIVFEIERLLSMEGAVLGALETNYKKISSCRRAILAQAFDGALFETSSMNHAGFASS